MKRWISLAVAAVLLLLCLTSCQAFRGTVECQRGENYVILTFYDFSGDYSLPLVRTLTGDGAVWFHTDLTEGTLSVFCREETAEDAQPLLVANAEGPLNGSSGTVTGSGEILFLLSADAPVSGEVILALSPEILQAVHAGNPALHEHTYRYDITESEHRAFYTCGCTEREEPSFERHDDGDGDGLCDRCLAPMPPMHEHTGEWVVTNETHALQYTCGCPSSDLPSSHDDADGDDVCDTCGYLLPGYWEDHIVNPEPEK